MYRVCTDDGAPAHDHDHDQEEMKWLSYAQTWSKNRHKRTRSKPHSARTAMEHIAIDLGSRESQICVRSERGDILDERRYLTPDLKSYLAKRAPGARVLLESSAEAFTVADWARQCRHEAHVVPSSLVRALGVGERGLKNDQRDARKLSEMDCRIQVPSIHIPSQMHREHQARVTARAALVEVRTKLVNTVRSFLRMKAMPQVRATPNTLAKNIRLVLLKTPDGVPDFIELLLVSIEGLNAQIEKADEALEQVADSDPVCKLLRTMPGVGVVTSVSFAAAIDDVSRFDSSAKVASYLGLTPGERTTGFKPRATGLTKAGSTRVRWTLNQAAWTLVRTRPDDPMVKWFQDVAGRRGKKVAITALCRKMSGVLFAMWRNQTPYNPTKAAKVLTP
jgi:transposase